MEKVQKTLHKQFHYTFTFLFCPAFHIHHVIYYIHYQQLLKQFY